MSKHTISVFGGVLAAFTLAGVCSILFGSTAAGIIYLAAAWFHVRLAQNSDRELSGACVPVYYRILYILVGVITVNLWGIISSLIAGYPAQPWVAALFMTLMLMIHTANILPDMHHHSACPDS